MGMFVRVTLVVALVLVAVATLIAVLKLVAVAAVLAAIVIAAGFAGRAFRLRFGRGRVTTLTARR